MLLKTAVRLTMPKAQYVNPASLPKPPGNFSWLVRSENVIWLAGIRQLMDGQP